MQVAGTKPRDVPPELMARYCRTVESEQVQGEQGSWKTFRELAKTQGEEELKAMLAVGSIESKLNPRMAGTEIKSPYNLLLNWSEEVWSNKKRRVETNEDTSGSNHGTSSNHSINGSHSASSSHSTNSSRSICPQHLVTCFHFQVLPCSGAFK